MCYRYHHETITSLFQILSTHLDDQERDGDETSSKIKIFRIVSFMLAHSLATQLLSND